MAGPIRVQRVRRVFDSPGEGWLYKVGDSHYVLVYTAASKEGWEACLSNETGAPPFSRQLLDFPARDRDAAVEKVKELFSRNDLAPE